MTTLSFNVFKEKLLSGEKTQTIRRIGKEAVWHWNNDGPKRIDIGTPLQIYWKQRQKKVWGVVTEQEFFKETCARQIRSSEDGLIYEKQIDGNEKLFDAVCTETFLIRMSTTGGGRHLDSNETGLFSYVDKRYIEELAKADGFEDGEYAPNKLEREKMEKEKTAAEKMFEWFDKYYSLDEPKIFQVIRWKRKGRV